MNFSPYFLTAALSLLAFTSGFALETKAAPVPAKTTDDIDIKKVSEAFGHFIGKNLKTSGLNFDTDSFIQGIRNGQEGKPSPLTEKEYEQQMMLLQERAFKKLADDNLSAAEGFLKKNAKEKGIIEVDPGKVQILTVKEGKGEAVKDGDSPQIQYTGSYIDGTVFGSSQDAGGSITIPLDQTIPGFSKGLKGMKEGEVRKIFVHPDAGYGKTGHLPPNSLLIFEVELIKANNKDALDASLSEADDDDADDDDDDEDDDEEPAAPAPKK
jgi:peptidylprolyl isomerase